MATDKNGNEIKFGSPVLTPKGLQGVVTNEDFTNAVCVYYSPGHMEAFGVGDLTVLPVLAPGERVATPEMVAVCEAADAFADTTIACAHITCDDNSCAVVRAVEAYRASLTPPMTADTLRAMSEEKLNTWILAQPDMYPTADLSPLAHALVDAELDAPADDRKRKEAWAIARLEGKL